MDFDSGLDIKNYVIPFIALALGIAALFTAVFVAASHRFDWIYVIVSMIIGSLLAVFIANEGSSIL